MELALVNNNENTSGNTSAMTQDDARAAPRQERSRLETLKKIAAREPPMQRSKNKSPQAKKQSYNKRETSRNKAPWNRLVSAEGKSGVRSL